MISHLSVTCLSNPWENSIARDILKNVAILTKARAIFSFCWQIGRLTGQKYSDCTYTSPLSALIILLLHYVMIPFFIMILTINKHLLRDRWPLLYTDLVIMKMQLVRWKLHFKQVWDTVLLAFLLHKLWQLLTLITSVTLLYARQMMRQKKQQKIEWKICLVQLGKMNGWWLMEH